MERDLATDIEIIWKISINCKENFLYCRYLHNPDTVEEKEYLQNSRHFHFFRHSLWRLCVIELNKLTSKSEHDLYNLWALLRNLRKDVYEFHNLPEEKIVEWESLLSKKGAVIKRIGLLRNKIYGHTDRGLNTSSFEISFPEIEEIIAVVEIILLGIYHHSFDTQILTETPIFQRERFNIIKILATEEKQRVNNITRFKDTE